MEALQAQLQGGAPHVPMGSGANNGFLRLPGNSGSNAMSTLSHFVHHGGPGTQNSIAALTQLAQQQTNGSGLSFQPMGQSQGPDK